MADQWFYASASNRVGPFSGMQLKELGAKGILLPTDTVWKEGIEKGVSIDEVKAGLKRLKDERSSKLTK